MDNGCREGTGRRTHRHREHPQGASPALPAASLSSLQPPLHARRQQAQLRAHLWHLQLLSGCLAVVATPRQGTVEGHQALQGLLGTSSAPWPRCPCSASCISTPLRALRQFCLSFRSIQIVLFACESVHLVYVLQCQRGNL